LVRFHIGTSGYSYPEWKGTFYPEKMKPPEMLGFYATQFGTVEINNTFYRMPTPAVIQGWAAQVPSPFRFVLKAPKRITHDRRLTEVGDPLTFFLNAALGLGDRLGPLLFQLPPNFKKDLARLVDFLGMLPDSTPAAIEFRNVTWFDDEVFDALRSKGVSLCIADTEDGIDTPFIQTARWGYFRLRDRDYSDDELRKWIDRARAQRWLEAYVFFKHEDSGRGPQFAQRFAALSS
jgi:uncharacterized protein YecE (DUF72 family)